MKGFTREDDNRSDHSDVTVYKPDFSQMVPFKPKVQWTPGEHIAPGIFFFLFASSNIVTMNT